MKKKNRFIVNISPDKVNNPINFKELIRFKDLLYFMVKRDITVLYKQTILGFGWAIINPFFQMIVFTVVFGKLANVPSDGIPYPIFSFAALVPWTYFNQSLTTATNSLIIGRNIYTKVYFPRIIIPLTPVLSKLADFFIATIFLFILMAFFNIYPTLSLLYLPLMIFIIMLISSGIGMWLSALAVQFRDVKFAATFLIQLLMYAAPVVFPASLILEKFGRVGFMLYGIYPLAGAIEGFRAAVLGINPIPWNLVLISFLSSLLVFFSGLLYFRKMEKVFADVA